MNEFQKLFHRYFSPTVAQFLQIAICLALSLADLDHIQKDSQSELIALGNILPHFLIAILPTLYAFSAFLATAGLGLQILEIYRENRIRELAVLIPWSLLWILHLIPSRGIVEPENLYILQLASAIVTTMTCFICSATSINDSRKNANSTDQGSSGSSIFTVPSDSKKLYRGIRKESTISASTAILHGIHQKGSHGGIIRKRRHRRDSNSPGRIGKSIASMDLDDVVDEGNSDALPAGEREVKFSRDLNTRQTSNGKPILAPSKFRSDTQSLRSSSASVFDADGTEFCETASSCRSPGSVVGSVWSAAPSRRNDDDALSVFSSVSRGYAMSTLFYPPSSVSQSKSTCSDVSKEWTWKFVAGIVLLVSLSTNAIVLGYLLSAGK